MAEWTRRERPTGFVHREELKRKLVEVLEDDEEEDPERTAESYIRAVVHTAGILEERFRNRFAFWHPTFEEFLAAISMATPSSAAADRLLPLRGDPRWREVIQLTIGYIGIITHDQRTATWVLKQLLEKDLDVLEPITQHRLRLVVDCIADDVGARRGLFEQVLNLFVEILLRQPYKLLGESFAKLVMSRMTFQPNDDTVQSLGKLIHHKI